MPHPDIRTNVPKTIVTIREVVVTAIFRFGMGAGGGHTFEYKGLRSIRPGVEVGQLVNVRGCTRSTSG
jgi:hypothetical protein